jgi:hypothetical protein
MNELNEVRRILCATPDETAAQAAQRVVHRNLELRLQLSKLRHRVQGAVMSCMGALSELKELARDKP